MALDAISGAIYRDTANITGKSANIETNSSSDTGAANISITEFPSSVKTSGNNQGGKDPNNGQKDNPFSEKQIKNAISSANNKLKAHRTRCEFSYNEDVKRVSIKMIDDDTKEVIKEIPPEETLEMIEKMWELAGILFDEKR